MSSLATSFKQLLDTQYPTTLFTSVKEPQGKQIHISYRKFLTELSNLILNESKDVPLLSPCKLDGEYRSDKNVIGINQLIFDIDHPKSQSFEGIIELLGHYAGAVHTTFSHEKNNPRYRVLLPLTRAVTKDEFSLLRENFLFCNPELEQIIDQACKDPARAFYLWSSPPERASCAQFFALIGTPINPNHFLNHALAASTSTHTRSFENLAKGGITEGGRNNALAAYLGGLINRGLPEEETLARCREWNFTLVPPLDDSELRATVNSIWKRHRSNSANNTLAAQQVASALVQKQFNLISANQLLGTPPKPREYLIDGFLPKKIVCGLFAAGGTGKSFLSLSIAVSLASGAPLFGKFWVSKPGKVVIVSGEDDSEEIQRRLHRITASLPPESKTLLGRNLHIIDLADQFELFTQKPAHGEVSITGVPNSISESIKNKIDGAELLIVDPASRFRGGEENLAADTTRFVQSLQLLRDHLQASILIVHHTNKSASINGASQNNARGSSALIDGIRLGYELSLIDGQTVSKFYGEQPPGVSLLSLRSVKSNYGPGLEPLTLKRNTDGTLSEFGQSPRDFLRRRLLSAIRAGSLSKTQFREKFGGVNGTFGLSEKALIRELDALSKRGLILIPLREPMTLTTAGTVLISPTTHTGDERAAN